MLDLTKGENFSIEKEAPGCTKLSLGLGWNPRKAEGEKFDLDSSFFILDENDKVLDLNNKNVVYFKNLKSACGSVVHSGDNLTGEGEGDDESITIDFSTLPEKAAKIKAIVNIFEAVQRNQNFGQVSNAYGRVFETESGKEIAKFDLTEDYSGSTAVHIADFYKHNGSWKFKAIGEGYKENLSYFASQAGL